MNNLNKQKTCINCGVLFVPQTNFKRRKYCSLSCSSSHNRVHSEETRNKLSNIRKEYLKNNIDKIYWKTKDKFKSKPCEFVKDYLRNNNIKFIEEWQPLVDRYFSIDIAFPDIKFGIEINGGQHYDKNGKLKKYYQERHDLIVKEGWNLIELHYTKAFNIDIIKSIIEFRKFEDQPDYSQFKKVKPKRTKKESEYTCKICDIKFLSKNKRNYCTQTCFKFSVRKLKDRPSKEELLNLLKEHSFVSVGKMFGVSDNSIRKWLK